MSKCIDLVATFTRHKLTDVQLKEIGRGPDMDLTELASRTITSDAEAWDVFESIMGAIKAVMEAAGSDFIRVSLYGVIPVPIRYILHRYSNDRSMNGKLFVFESFTIQRAEEGSAPKFEHLKWLQTECVLLRL